MNYSLVTVGNPNSGKTSLFNALTGARQQVGNWSGVTVDKKMGEFSAKGQDYTLMDLPGIEVRSITEMTGAQTFNEVFFTDVRIPAENLVDEMNDSWRLAKVTLGNERVSLSTGGVL